jgi:sugar lactone lactonase YvrE
MKRLLVFALVVEGPTADADGSLYFSDVNASRIMKLDTAGRLTTFRQPSNRANGMVFDTQFRLLIAFWFTNNVAGC